MMQKFQKGDHVMISKDLGSMMRYFKSDCEAIIIGSYADQCGGNDTKNYTLHIKGHGESSWHHEHQLTLIKKNCMDKLEQWESEDATEKKQKSDLDWIFANGHEVIKQRHSASIESLANCFGFVNLWGSQGEGLIYYRNTTVTLSMAEPFLKSGDKAGWLEYANKRRTVQ